MIFTREDAPMKLVSWNVNGLRACLGKGFLDFCAVADADIICLQETKMRPEQAEFDLPGYHRYWNSADKAGYSGTAVFTRRQPLSVTYDFGIDEHRHEGRVITAEYPDFYLVCCYTPNSKDQLARLDYRMAGRTTSGTTCWIWTPKSLWCDCGDLNVAHQEIDIKIPVPTAATRLYRRGAGEDDEAPLQRLCGHVPVSVPGQDRGLLLVELPLQCPEEQRRVADRLLHRVGAAEGQNPERRYLERGAGQRPLPGGTGSGCINFTRVRCATNIGKSCT